MKRCPQCGQTYTDSLINFCLNDGELLSYLADDAPQTLFQNEPPKGFADDAPPTVFLNKPRVTNQTNWPASAPPVQWQGQQNLQNQPYRVPSLAQTKDQTLPTISLILGIISLVMVCCYGGIWLGLPAAIIGYLGMKNADNDPNRYTGRGLAVAGMVMGIVTCLISIGYIIFIILAMLAS